MERQKNIRSGAEETFCPFFKRGSSMKTSGINQENQRRMKTTWAHSSPADELSCLVTWTSAIMNNQTTASSANYQLHSIAYSQLIQSMTVRDNAQYCVRITH